jgi:hypothetical protein
VEEEVSSCLPARPLFLFPVLVVLCSCFVRLPSLLYFPPLMIVSLSFFLLFFCLLEGGGVTICLRDYDCFWRRSSIFFLRILPLHVVVNSCLSSCLILPLGRKVWLKSMAEFQGCIHSMVKSKEENYSGIGSFVNP